MVLGMILLVMTLCMWGCSRSTLSPELQSALPERVDYNFHIKPILSDRCFTCHGPDPNTREAGLRLDTPEGFQEPMESTGRPAIVPGKPGKSALIERIYHSDPDEVMPPATSNLSLTETEKALLTRWIEQGAEWKPHWAFIPPSLPAIPSPEGAESDLHPIDAFVQKQLHQHGLTPSSAASKEILIRRVTFDLTGLPPTLDTIDAFLADTSEQAFERIVDQLLSSTAFGERMASEWLDVARYADTGGYQSDRLRRMWPWRDWVIQAFNENLPYSDFLTWQLAGDLLPEPTRDQLLATAFNRNHRQTEEGGSIEEEFRTEYVADRAQTTATAFLGLTMDCARCHDHKYDPISQKEYYQFFSFFNTLDESGQTSHFTDAVPVPTLLLTTEEEDRQLETLRQEIIDAEEQLRLTVHEQQDAFVSWLNDASVDRIPPLPTSGLAAYLPLDRIEGNRTPNRANTNLPGMAVFDPRTSEGYQGKAVIFDGENGFDVKGVGAYTRTTPFTIAFWMRASEWNDWNVVVHHTKAALDAGSRGYEVAMQHNQVVVGMAHMWPENAIRIVSSDSLHLNQWHHIAVTYDGSSKASGLTLFIDGAPSGVNIVRDNLFKNITYERTEVHLTLGYRFRDTGFRNGALDELRVYNRQLVPLEIAQLAGREPFETPFKGLASLTEADRKRLERYYLHVHNPAYRETLKALKQLRDKENTITSTIDEIMVMRDMESPRKSYVLHRGAYDDKGEEVSPGTPERILAFPDHLPQTRLGLAKWLLAPENPLTARVAVNRFWQMLFGQGLVATPEDFGNQGALPTHPELLDWLAITFRDSDWDIKALIKMIVMSDTYRQTSHVSDSLRQLDPSNNLLARGPQFRLTAEMVRDMALASSGALVEKVGGPPVKPYQPAGLWKEKSGAVYEPDQGEGLYRRSLYTFWKRTSPPPSMILFDASRRNQCIVRRQATSTPLQALVLLNDPQYIEASRILAERVHAEGGNALQDRITFAFRMLTGRYPSDQEIDVLMRTYNEQLSMYTRTPGEAHALLSIGDKPYRQDIPAAELAAHTVVANTILNLDASVIKR